MSQRRLLGQAILVLGAVGLGEAGEHGEGAIGTSPTLGGVLDPLTYRFSQLAFDPRHGGAVVNVHLGKHAGYWAAIRLGFDVPETWLLPHKVPPDNERFAFTRGLAIGPQTMVMHYDPTKPLHLRYQVDHEFLTPEAGQEIVTWDEKLAAYRALVDDYYEADRFREFCDRHLAHADECMAEYVDSDQFDAHLVETIAGVPPHEHEQFIAHYRGLLGAWVSDQRRAVSA